MTDHKREAAERFAALVAHPHVDDICAALLERFYLAPLSLWRTEIIVTVYDIQNAVDVARARGKA